MINNIKKLQLWKSILLFAAPSVYFIAMTQYFTPYLSKILGVHPALSWYITAYLIFIPLFIGAILLAKRESPSITNGELLKRFRFKKLTKSDLHWTIGATVLIFAAMGLIMLASQVLSGAFGIPALKTTPPFMQFGALKGWDRSFLLVWLPMFFFNIVGEQMLWQGYILPRQELEHGKWAWLVNAFCWMIFHICFGVDLIILLIPCLMIIPFTIQKTKNTTTGMLVHAIVNGPMAIVVALGLIH
jgi:hypothetical protein